MSQSPISQPANLSLIVAVSKNGVIGRDGRLPWQLPEDLRRFKALTMGHHIIMGRRTFESLGRCLPGRTNVVVTQSTAFDNSGAAVVRSLSAALELAADDDEPFVIGGLRIFEAAWPKVGRIYLTRILCDAEGDVHLELIVGDCRSGPVVPRRFLGHSSFGGRPKIPFQFQKWNRQLLSSGESKTL
jgi:dihydrofolate reductase